MLHYVTHDKSILNKIKKIPKSCKSWSQSLIRPLKFTAVFIVAVAFAILMRWRAIAYTAAAGAGTDSDAVTEFLSTVTGKDIVCMNQFGNIF